MRLLFVPLSEPYLICGKKGEKITGGSELQEEPEPQSFSFVTSSSQFSGFFFCDNYPAKKKWKNESFSTILFYHRRLNFEAQNMSSFSVFRCEDSSHPPTIPCRYFWLSLPLSPDVQGVLYPRWPALPDNDCVTLIFILPVNVRWPFSQLLCRCLEISVGSKVHATSSQA